MNHNICKLQLKTSMKKLFDTLSHPAQLFTPEKLSESTNGKENREAVIHFCLQGFSQSSFPILFTCRMVETAFPAIVKHIAGINTKQENVALFKFKNWSDDQEIIGGR